MPASAQRTNSIAVGNAHGSESTYDSDPEGVEQERGYWQDGYGAFSIGRSDIPSLKKYIAGQKDHHRKRSFQEGLVQFLDEYRIRRAIFVGLIRPFQGRGSILGT